MTKAVKDHNKAFALAQVQIKAEIERFNAQAAFAEWLVTRHKNKAAAWSKLIADARGLVSQAAGRGIEAVRTAVRAAEESLAPMAETARSYTLYLVGHAHIDMNWMWSWPETVGLTTDTFRTVFNLMEEFPFFVFSQSQASVYRIIEEHDPEMLARIRQLVKEGRWEVTASHWVECEKNIVGGEALCRHLLYTRRYMQDLFGLKAEDVPVDWAPDTFGHAATAPSYLVQGGVKYTYLHRPGVHTPPQPRPRAFRWQAPDKAEVLVHNDMRLGYNGQINPGMVKAALQDFTDETGLPYGLFVYGVGDHGGGPTRRDLRFLDEMRGWPIYPELKPARVVDYFDRLAGDSAGLPVIADELNFEFAGCYTTQTLIKRANRFAEKYLADAEAACTAVAALTGRAYPQGRFEDGWRDTLFSHFHDILPGSGVRATRTYTHGLFQKTMAMTSMEEKKALLALAGRVDTSAAAGSIPDTMPAGVFPRAMGAGIGRGTDEGGFTQYGPAQGNELRPFVVWNPLGVEREEVVEAMVWDPVWGIEDDAADYTVTGPDGQPVAAQVLDKGNYWGHTFVRLAFPVMVPPLGYALYIAAPGKASTAGAATGQTGIKHACSYAWYERGGEGLENAFTRMTVDMQTGGIRELVDKQTGAVIIDAARPAPVLQYGVERPRGMTAWVLEHTSGWEGLEVVSIARGVNGPYKASMIVKLRKDQSEFTVTYELRANDPALRIGINGLWFERGTREKGTPVLRLSLPLTLSDPQAVYEIPFSARERSMPANEEVPALNWAAVHGTAGVQKAGCLLLNDCKHGHSLENGALCVTLIRSSSDPDVLPEAGEHAMQFALVPTTGAPDIAAAVFTGEAFCRELRVVATDAHEGDLPPFKALMQVSPHAIQLTGLKAAEDGDGLILRLVSHADRKGKAKVRFDELLGTPSKPVSVDLLERPLAKNAAAADGNSITVDVPARSIVTVKVKLKK